MLSPKSRVREHGRSENKAEHDRQRQTYQEQPLRKAPIAPEDAEIRVGSVGEQNHSQCEFCQKSKPLASYVQAEYAQGIRAENKTNSDEHKQGREIAISRPCNWTESPIHSAGDQPVTPTAVTARFTLKPEGTSADRGFRAGRPGGGVAAQYRDGSA